jgi:xanthine/CO dehydrogenase XdhC/CoxF family maturation factor
VLATVVKVRGASPAKVGAQIVLLEDGTTTGTVGGRKLKSAILDDAHLTLTESLPRLPKYSLTEKGVDAVGTLCGREVRVFIQPFVPPPQLIIVGSGHIGRPLKGMGEAAGFDVLVVEAEAGRANVLRVGLGPFNAGQFHRPDHDRSRLGRSRAETSHPFACPLYRHDRQSSQMRNDSGSPARGWSQ